VVGGGDSSLSPVQRRLLLLPRAAVEADPWAAVADLWEADRRQAVDEEEVVVTRKEASGAAGGGGGGGGEPSRIWSGQRRSTARGWAAAGGGNGGGWGWVEPG